MSETLVVSCPRCGIPVIWKQSNYRPFCSERCATGDLGDWAKEKYKVPVQEESPQIEDSSDSEDQTSPIIH